MGVCVPFFIDAVYRRLQYLRLLEFGGFQGNNFLRALLCFCNLLLRLLLLPPVHIRSEPTRRSSERARAACTAGDSAGSAAAAHRLRLAASLAWRPAARRAPCSSPAVGWPSNGSAQPRPAARGTRLTFSPAAGNRLAANGACSHARGKCAEQAVHLPGFTPTVSVTGDTVI